MKFTKEEEDPSNYGYDGDDYAGVSRSVSPNYYDYNRDEYFRGSRSVSTDYGYHYVRRAFSTESQIIMEEEPVSSIAGGILQTSDDVKQVLEDRSLVDILSSDNLDVPEVGYDDHAMACVQEEDGSSSNDRDDYTRVSRSVSTDYCDYNRDAYFRGSRSVSTDYGYHYVRRAFSLESETSLEDGHEESAMYRVIPEVKRLSGKTSKACINVHDTTKSTDDYEVYSRMESVPDSMSLPIDANFLHPTMYRNRRSVTPDYDSDTSLARNLSHLNMASFSNIYVQQSPLLASPTPSTNSALSYSSDASDSSKLNLEKFLNDIMTDIQDGDPSVVQGMLIQDVSSKAGLDVKVLFGKTTKASVGSRASQQASYVRRKKPAKFFCTFQGCNSSFTRNAGLKSHYKSHLGVTDLECPFCGIRTATSLDRHKNRCKQNPNRNPTTITTQNNA